MGKNLENAQNARSDPLSSPCMFSGHLDRVIVHEEKQADNRMDFNKLCQLSRDNWHKRRKTGGKRKPYHKKRKYELGRPPANTKDRIETSDRVILLND